MGKHPILGKITVLLFCEGLHEAVFLQYLKSVYSRNKSVEVSIKRGKGGGLEELVRDAHKTPGAYDKKHVVLDTDLGEQEIECAEKVAKEVHIELIKNSPCLEAILLSILKKGKKFGYQSSSWCKREFQNKYLDKKNRTIMSKYRKVFPKKLLDDSRKLVAELDKLISIMEGKI